ncbi:nucleoside triphosphate pyrophosphohydrolase [Rossellomorea aquimaris]|uniref:Putative house-cleaning noncanonical NTP pyrophosphatase (MazG superfamily) n=1 Tax=Rossellomorea aquimaris TaxID=189382 RepID=A0A366ECR9_9BACI|nr:nucleoside triphosphate pyrophosphohydrolase [Rossellomorea aquimaris]RBP00187.1 putative house-cleaning noncanonical NTP pyrophosphatase (MazG superfamily) [Rossellomorea aquimaris]
MPTYNKLVRDKIPQILENKGREYSTKILNDEDYIKYLKEKAYEELDEYCAAETNGEAVEELADLLEVIRSLAKQHESTFEDVEAVRKDKAEKRGGFQDKVFLMDVEE